MTTEVNFLEILKAGFEKPVPAERGIGCGRIYVSITSPDKFVIAGIRKACKKLGKIYQAKSHYGASNAIYIGYDNCDGQALARGTAVVEALKAAGISCYRDEQGD